MRGGLGEESSAWGYLELLVVVIGDKESVAVGKINPESLTQVSYNHIATIFQNDGKQ